MLYYLNYLIFPAFFVWILLKTLLPYLSRFVIDNPNFRSSHEKSTPNGGGLAIVLIGILYSLTFNAWYPTITIFLAFVGFLDDYKKINNSIRFVFQFFTSFIIAYNSEFILNIRNLSSSFIYSISLILVVFFFLCIINFTNFVDGLDGFLASNMIVILFMISLSGRPELLPIVGALFGFLILNWSPAKVFMGDVGSTFLGTVMFGSLLQMNSLIDIFGLILISFPLMADASICLIRRFIAKQNLFKAHNLHLYQRLYRAGMSHSNVTLLYLSCTISLATTYKYFGLQVEILTALIILLVGFFIERYKAVPFFNKLEKV